MHRTLILAMLLLAGCAAPTETLDETPAPTAEANDDAVRFIAWGDTGTGKDEQYITSESALRVCLERGCDFVVTMGDLIYEDGVTSPYDPLFESNFELPYEAWNITFYQSLGNHDNGNGEGTNQAVAEHEIAYHYRNDRMSEKWHLPSRYYTATVGPVQLFALDTNTMVLLGDLQHERDALSMEQQAWLDAEIAASDAPVKIAFGHHPYISNGMHGDAGMFDGRPTWGLQMKRIFDESVCGEMDLYLSGHDHDLQWLEPGACGDTELVVSGAAAKTRPLGDNDHPAFFAQGDTLGFFWFEVAGDTVTGVAYDGFGQPLFERTFSV